jgi:hypothetical protein
MTSRQINLLLTCGAITTSVAAVVIVAAGFLMPISSSSDGTTRPGSAEFSSSGKPATQPAGLDRLFARSFRNALDDAPSASAKAAAMSAASTRNATASPLQVTLIGTIGNSLAMLRLADGSVIARGVGEQIEGAELIRIDSASVAFQRDGQQFSIVKPAADVSASNAIVIR